MNLLFAVTFISILCGPIAGQESSLDVAKPKSYDLYFNLANSHVTRTFLGVLRLEIECMEQSSSLYLNCKDLEIELSTANITEGLDVEEVLVKDEVCELQLSGEMQVGKSYLVELDFKGKLNDDPTGIFDQSYTQDYITRK